MSAYLNPRRTAVSILAAFGMLGACGGPALDLTADDWSSSGYEILFDKTRNSVPVARAIRFPDQVRQADLQTLAGIAFRFGIGTEKDLDQAAELLTAACQQDQMRACRDYGKVLAELGSPDQLLQAAGLFAESCDAGILLGCSDMAAVHIKGAGAEKNLVKAISYIEQACAKPAELVCAEAAAELAESNLTEALKQLDGSCKAGGMMACHRSGHFRMESGDSALYPLGIQNHEIACAAGFIFSCEAVVGAKDKGDGDPANIDAALQALDRACAEGYVNGCYHLGYAFSGIGQPGIPPNPEKVFRSTSLGCGHGDSESCRWTAEFLEAGTGTPKNLPEAARIYHWMCEQGDQRMCQQAARVEVAMAPASEDAPPAEVRGAIVERACELGDGEACRGIAWSFVFGQDGRTRNAGQAALHFRIGCDKGAANACIDIGSLNEWAEHGFMENKRAALTYYKRACDLGEALGCQLLEQSKLRAG